MEEEEEEQALSAKESSCGGVWRLATCDLVCWHFARILHKLVRFMGQPLRLDSLETAAEKGAGLPLGMGSTTIAHGT